MNWIRRHFFFAAFFATVTVLLVGLGFLIVTAYDRYGAVSQRWVEVSNHLRALQNTEWFPSPSNLTHFKKLEKEYIREASGFANLLCARQLLLDPSMSPQVFQDRLRNHVSTTTAKAKAAKVTLPPNFYLGFDQYRSVLPPQNAAPELARELDVISGIISQLMESRIFNILEVHRFPMMEESDSSGQAFAFSDKVQRRVFDIRFVADQSRFRSAFNSILNFPQFLSIEALQVINSQPLAPRKEEDIDEKTRTQNHRVVTDSPPVEKTTRLIFGEEKLTVTARIAMLTFLFPESLSHNKDF